MRPVVRGAPQPPLGSRECSRSSAPGHRCVAGREEPPPPAPRFRGEGATRAACGVPGGRAPISSSAPRTCPLRCPAPRRALAGLSWQAGRERQRHPFREAGLVGRCAAAMGAPGPPRSPGLGSGARKAAGAAGLVLLYYGFSIGITFYNKWIMRVGGRARRGAGAAGPGAGWRAGEGPTGAPSSPRAELRLPALHDAAAPAGHLRALGPGPPLRQEEARARRPALDRLPAPRGARR